MSKKSFLIAIILLMPSTALFAWNNLPQWTNWSAVSSEMTVVAIPGQLQVSPSTKDLKYVVLQLAQDWTPEWKSAAFELKGLIVTIKSTSPNALIGIEASEKQITALLDYEMAAYFDGYLYEETPFLPEADQTGKLWLHARISATQVLSTLVDASSLGVELVLFQGLQMTEEQLGLLDVVANTSTGSLDLAPDVAGINQEDTTFFFDPTSGNYHLAVYASKGQSQRFTFPLGNGTNVSLIYPEKAGFEHLQFGKTTEITLNGDSSVYFFLLKPMEKAAATASLEVSTRKIIDPYELVVKNQVFKRNQSEIFQSLEVDEELNYRYQAANGIDIDVTYLDRIFDRKDKVIERIRKETYVTGVRWSGEKQPELPLISPEKVQTVPLVIDFDKSYTYTYKGEDTIGGHPTWKVKFVPTSDGKFYAGTVWIDQETGGHRKIRAVQAGLDPPITGNEMSVYFDWVEQNGQRFWTQVREENLQLVNIVGERIAILISSRRSNYSFNEASTDETLAVAYKSKATILRDTDKGFRYLKRTSDGGREVNNDQFFKKRAALGGILLDPSLDTPIPLGGFNYTNLNFMGKYQANFFVAGAINDLIVSNPNFLGKGWDLTTELFLTPLYFGDTVYENNERRDDLEVKSLTESFNITLGVPFANYWKVGANYSLRYVDFKEGDDTDENYVLPKSHLQHIGRIDLDFSRNRFISKLNYTSVTRSTWEDFGLPADSDTVEDKFSSVRLDMGYSKSLPKFQTLAIEGRYLKGWDLDRFSRFGFGFFANRVPGFGTSGIRGDEAYRLKLEYEIGIKGLFNVKLDLVGARAMLDEPVVIGGYLQPEKVDLAGLGLAFNLIGPWQTLIRLDMGYGAYSTIAAEEGDFSGQIGILKLF